MSCRVSTSTHCSSHTCSTKSLGLPYEQYRTLLKRHTWNRVDIHFTDYTVLPPCPKTYTPYQQVGLPHDRRVRISETEVGTRRALGGGFDFTNTSYDQLQRNSIAKKLYFAENQRGNLKPKLPMPQKYPKQANQQQAEHAGISKPTIPQKYISEFNEKWVEDDELYNKVQTMADFTRNASWRIHAPMYNDIAPVPHTQQNYFGDFKRELVEDVDMWDRAHGIVPSPPPGENLELQHRERQKSLLVKPPHLVSKFSFDSDSDISVNIGPPKSKFYGLRKPW